MYKYIIIIIIVLILLFIFITYNSLVKLNNKVKEAFSTMDVYLKKRWDLIPNLVEVVKGYAEHEKTTLENVINLRNSTYDNLSNDEKINTNIKLANELPKLIALAESYPELKASENYKNLSDNLVKVEDEIANSRKYYNATVRDLNNKIEMFPSNIIALLFKFKAKKMFEATENDRESVKVDL